MSSTLSSIGRLTDSLKEMQRDSVPIAIALTALGSYRRQSRQSISQQELEELADSIRSVGVLQPILVRPLGDGKYEIIAGERRSRAAAIAGLEKIPALVTTANDETVDKMHLAENTHRVNLTNMEMAERVQADLDLAQGDLDVVAKKYSMAKSWVSKMSSMARGGELMHTLIAENVTADHAVLASVSSMERSNPESAKELVEKIKAAPTGASAREIAANFAKKKKVESKPEPQWRVADAVKRSAKDACTLVKLSKKSAYFEEFEALELEHGEAYLSKTHRHPNSEYAVIEFGAEGANRRTYKADELRLSQIL